jgi:hypothetical protein
MTTTISRYLKFVSAVVGLLALGLANGLLSGSAAHYVSLVIGAATALGVYAAPNAPAPSAPSSPSGSQQVFDPSSGHTLTVSAGRVVASTAQPNNDPAPTPTGGTP